LSARREIGALVYLKPVSLIIERVGLVTLRNDDEKISRNWSRPKKKTPP
jgi:hypothetical protein